MYKCKSTSFTIRFLKTPDEIKAAKSLLRQVYITTADEPWNFGENNPSNIHCEWDSGINSYILTDDFADSALWVGVFSNTMILPLNTYTDSNTAHDCNSNSTLKYDSRTLYV